MNLVTLNYFDTEIVKELMVKWYKTKTHTVNKIINDDRYMLFGAKEANGVDNEIAISIYPTFKEKLDKWNWVFLVHMGASNASVIAACFLKKIN